MSEGGGLDPELRRELGRLARAPVLLVASDFDGTLAPIVDEPSEARPLPGAARALSELAALERTHVAVVSGRARRVLAALGGFDAAVELVGSHGGEPGRDFPAGLSAAELALRERLLRELAAIAERGPGLAVEPKPAGAALHYRNAAEALGREAVAAVLAGPARLPGACTRHGKMVVELAAIDASKAGALDALRRRANADATLFLGDDLTDEEAFAVLSEADLGVKVGPGATRARHRVESPLEVVRALEALAELRRIRPG